MKRIIKSLLDTDLYKFFMLQIIFHRYTDVTAEYEYKLRNKNIKHLFTYDFMNKLEEEIDILCSLQFSENELLYLESLETNGIYYFKEDFIEYLRLFKLNKNHVHLNRKERTLEFIGPWISVMMFEIYVLEIISELYSFIDWNKYKQNISIGKQKLNKKIKLIQDYNNKHDHILLKYADFGGRRRISYTWHEYVLNLLKYKTSENLIGTSNVYLSRLFKIKPIGTHAHEYFQAHQALNNNLINFQREALQHWANEYRGTLGIALTDTLNMDAFLYDFDLYFCKLFDGCRHDSGDPFQWCEKLINHYKNMNIDPMTKSAIFSDSLTIKKSILILEKFKNLINVSFGIGSHFTNDASMKYLNHVIKMVRCNDQDVAKISESPGKGMCKNQEYVNYLKSVFAIIN